MKQFLSFLGVASLVSRASGKIAVILNLKNNFPNSEERSFRLTFPEDLKKENVKYIINPLNGNMMAELSQKDFTNVIVQTHGLKNEKDKLAPTMNLTGEFITIPRVVSDLNSATKNLSRIDLSACYIGDNFEQLSDPESPYYKEINQALKEDQLLFLHGDEYQGLIANSYSDRLPHLIANQDNYSIMEALLDSGESLRVVLKKNGELQSFAARNFGRNGEDWTIENYRNHLREVAKEVKEFEVKNGILYEGETRIDIEKLSDEKLHKSLGFVFTSYLTKLLDENSKQQDEVDLLKSGLSVSILEKVTAAEEIQLELEKKILNITNDGFVNSFCDYIGNTPLMITATKKYSGSATRQLIKSVSHQTDFKAYLNKQENLNKWTALINAAHFNEQGIISLLIDVGADPNIVDKEGNTALVHAIKNSNYDVVKYLSEAQQNLDLKNKDGETALVIATRQDASDDNFLMIIKQLLDKGADCHEVKQEVWQKIFSQDYSAPRDPRSFNPRQENILLEISRHLEEKNIHVKLSDETVDKILENEACRYPNPRIEFLMSKNDLSPDKIVNKIKENPEINIFLIKFLGDQKSEIDWGVSSLMPVMVELAKLGDFETVKSTLKKYSIVKENQEVNPTRHASRGFIRPFMIDSNALDYQDRLGFSLLYYAMQEGDEGDKELASFLMQNGARRPSDSKNFRGSTNSNYEAPDLGTPSLAVATAAIATAGAMLYAKNLKEEENEKQKKDKTR